MHILAKSTAKPGLWLESTLIPSPKPNEVLIKISKTAICGTDVHIFHWNEWAQQTIPIPMHIGHEFVGTIVEKGTLVSDHIQIGARVSGEGHVVCGTCRNCRAGKQHLCPNTKGIGVNLPGAFAEYLALPASNVFLLPDFISDDEAAIFDPFGNAVHTALAFDCVGEDVLITGAGPIGIMCAIIARHVGARHIAITDTNPHRLELVPKHLNIHCINPNKNNMRDVMQTLGMKEGFDVGMELSGNPLALNQMIDFMLNGAKIALLGLFNNQQVSLNLNKMIFKGLEVKGIYGRQMYETWYKMQTLLESGLAISPVITHTFHYKDFEQAFETIDTGKCGKVLLDWTQS